MHRMPFLGNLNSDQLQQVKRKFKKSQRGGGKQFKIQYASTIRTKANCAKKAAKHVSNSNTVCKVSNFEQFVPLNTISSRSKSK